MADNAARKRKKSAFYAKSAAKKSKTCSSLQAGLKGFIATCNYREKDCVREAINILSEFADRLYGEEKKTSSDTQASNKKIVFKDSDSEEDIETALAEEVDALKQERQSDPGKRRFQIVDSGAANCVFIRTTVEDPVLVVENILKEIEYLSKQKTRFLLRLLPIEVTCKAWPDDIKIALEKLIDKHFKGEPKSFCVVFKRRNNTNAQRDELINDIASAIKLQNPLHRADMKQPDVAILVEIIRNVCCMSVVPKYFYYRKYNLLEVAKLKASVVASGPDDNGDKACEVNSVSNLPNSSDVSQADLHIVENCVKSEEERSTPQPESEANTISDTASTPVEDATVKEESSSET